MVHLSNYRYAIHIIYINLIFYRNFHNLYYNLFDIVLSCEYTLPAGDPIIKLQIAVLALFIL